MGFELFKHKEHGRTNLIKDKLLFSTLGAFLFTISNLLYS